jgi:hypothetical protein
MGAPNLGQPSAFGAQSTPFGGNTSAPTTGSLFGQTNTSPLSSNASANSLNGSAPKPTLFGAQTTTSTFGNLQGSTGAPGLTSNTFGQPSTTPFGGTTGF